MASQLLAWFRKMVEIRAFEDRVQELFMDGVIQGTTHLCQGQEAVSVGAIAALLDQDYLTTTYRGHGQALARGMSLDRAFAELMGRATGSCHGMGGSMHLSDFSLGLIGSFAIVGAGLPVAVGAAMSGKLRGRHSVAMTFIGDGATNIGTFHESLNMAAVWRAPVVFVIENNLYAEYSALRDTTAITELAERARSYGMPGIAVDGQDVAAVHTVAVEAVTRARSGGGPTLIEAKTYRYRGHSRSDPAKYRPEAELKLWKERDPIAFLGSALMVSGSLSPDARAGLIVEAQRNVDDASRRAAEAPYPTLQEAATYVYST